MTDLEAELGQGYTVTLVLPIYTSLSTNLSTNLSFLPGSVLAGPRKSEQFSSRQEGQPSLAPWLQAAFPDHALCGPGLSFDRGRSGHLARARDGTHRDSRDPWAAPFLRPNSPRRFRAWGHTPEAARSPRCPGRPAPGASVPLAPSPVRLSPCAPCPSPAAPLNSHRPPASPPDRAAQVALPALGPALRPGRPPHRLCRWPRARACWRGGVEAAAPPSLGGMRALAAG